MFNEVNSVQNNYKVNCLEQPNLKCLMKWTVFRTTKPMVNRVQNSCWVKNKTYWINTCSQLVLLALKYRCDKNIAYPIGFEFKLKSRCVKSDLNWNPHVTRVNWNWNPDVTWVNWNWNPDVTKVCQHWCKVSVEVWFNKAWLMYSVTRVHELLQKHYWQNAVLMPQGSKSNL